MRNSDEMIIGKTHPILLVRLDEPQNNFSELKKGIIKRNEIITLLSSLMASGLKTNLIISSMESIVLDIFDSSKKARDLLTSLIHQGFCLWIH